MNSPPKAVVTTARTTISEITIADAPFMFDLFRTPGWLKYIGDRNLANVAEVEVYLQNGLLKVRSERGYGYFLARNADGQSIGVAGFLKREFLDHEDFGFAFMPDHYNLGYAFEVGEALLRYAVPRFGFSVLDAVTMQTNLPSQRLLKKLGFWESGHVIMPDTNEELLLFRCSFDKR